MTENEMNRQQRRYAERQARKRAAGADHGFEAFSTQVHRTFKTRDEREIGEAWMRGQAWDASGADSMVIHRKG